MPTATTRYVVGLLRRGPTSIPPAQGDAKARVGEHRAILARLQEIGEIIAYGPLEGPNELVELVLFRTASVDAARALLQSDPMISSGQLVMELRTWIGPEGLQVGEIRANPTDLDFTTD